MNEFHQVHLNQAADQSRQSFSVEVQGHVQNRRRGGTLTSTGSGPENRAPPNHHFPHRNHRKNNKVSLGKQFLGV